VDENPEVNVILSEPILMPRSRVQQAGPRINRRQFALPPPANGGISLCGEQPIEHLNVTMQSSAQVCPSVSDIPGRHQAELALAAAFQGGRPSFSCAVVHPVPEAMAWTEPGFCRQADDALLAAFIELVRGALPGDQVFRWTATSLLVLMAETPDDARLRAARSGMFRLSCVPNADALKRDIDQFVARSANS